MRIGVNCLFLKPGQVGGAEYVLQSLLIGLAQTPKVELYIFINQELLPWLEKLKLGSVRVMPIKIWGNRFISEAFQLPRIVNQFQLAGLINTNYFTPWRFLLNCPSVTIIYDLNYLHFPHLYSWYKGLWLRLAHQITLNNAIATVTISEFVKQDIQKNYGNYDSIKVIYTPINWNRLEVSDSKNGEIPDSLLVKEPFILSVANHYQHKNLATLVKAFAKLLEVKDSENGLKLVLVGQLPDSLVGMRRDRCDDIRQLVNELNIEEKVLITGYVSDRQLAWYYERAVLLAFPSLFEGFGMPPVEALGMGLPVLTTNCTAIPEVTMNLAEYVENPIDVTEWCERLNQMLNEQEKYLPTTEIIRKVRERFSPAIIAQKYLDLFANLVSQIP
jgi:glycosyltransferase involved in cell wall biosynthesis